MARKGFVFTFSNWYHPHRKDYWQSVELFNEGNLDHNFGPWGIELFDEKIHQDFVLVTAEVIAELGRKFIENFGA